MTRPKSTWWKPWGDNPFVVAVLLVVGVVSIVPTIRSWFIQEQDTLPSTTSSIAVAGDANGPVVIAGRDVSFSNSYLPQPRSTDFSPSATPSVETAVTELSGEELAIAMVISYEVEAATRQEISRLKGLFADDAVIVDGRGNEDPNDDLYYEGWENIEKRYLVFFNCCRYEYSIFDPVIEVSSSNDEATVLHGGILRYGKFYSQTTLYRLKKVDANWLITELKYNYRVTP